MKGKRKYTYSILIVAMIVFALYIYPHVDMKYVQAATYRAATEYDGIGANTISNCVAFAKYKVPSLPGGLTTLQDKKNIINSYTPAAGAIAITSGDSRYGHVAYVESVSGANIVTLNGGFSGSGLDGHIVRITGTAGEQKILGYWCPSGLNLGNNPQGLADSINGGLGTIHVGGWAFDKDNVNASLQLHVYIGGAAGTQGAEGHVITAGNERPDVGSAYPGVGNYHGYDATIQTNKRGVQPVYIYAINVGGGGNILIGQKTVTIDSDKTPPVISDVKVYDISENGYKVQCKVTDNIQVDRVQFPTWTEQNWQDDLTGEWWSNPACCGTKNGDIYTFYVKRTEHNNEYGIYHTHIYAWDKEGNSVMVGAEDVVLEKDDENPVIKKAEIKEVTADKLTLHIEVSDNKQIKKMECYCIPAFKKMGTAGTVLGICSEKQFNLSGETFSGDVVIDLSGGSRFIKLSDYHALYVSVTDTSGNWVRKEIPFYLSTGDINEVKLQVGESISKEAILEKLGVTPTGAWICRVDEDESILKKQWDSNDKNEPVLFTAVKSGVEYIYFKNYATCQVCSCRITVLGDSGGEEKTTETKKPSCSYVKI